MIDQRKPVQGEGLPRTACAPDLFTRIDALKGGAIAHKDFPVRWYLGFGTPLPDFQQLRGDGFVWQVVVAFAGKPADGAILRRGKDLATGILIVIIWCLGFLADVMTTAKLGLGGKNDPVVRDISAEIAAKELTARLSGSDPTWATAIDQAARNYLVPTITITPGEAVSAYLAGVIDVQAAGDYGKFGGVCQVATDIVIETQQQRPDVQSMLQLWHRRTVDEARVDDQARQLGWLKSEYVEWQKELFWQLPQPGEFVGWMRSGFTSEETAAALQLDSGFDSAYNDEKKRWAEAAGLRDDQVKRLWRATYQWPSVQEAIDWFRRTQAGYLAGQGAINETALQEIISHSATPPAFQGAVFASRFTPLTSRLLRTAYDENVATDQQVLAALRADGFSEEDAQILFSEWQRLKPKYTAAKVGLPSVGRLVSMYADATIGTSELQAGGARLGLDQGELGELLTAAQNERTVKHRATMLSTVKGSYLAGAIDDHTMRSVLNSVLADSDNAGDVASLWRAEFEARPRPDQAGELAKSFKAGMIDESEYVDSLTQLRFTPEQIARIIAAAGIAEASEALKNAEKMVSTTRKRLSADAKEWASLIHRAEKLVGKVEQRTHTSAGKLMSWIKSRVAKAPKQVSEKGPQNGVQYHESASALAEAEAFVEENHGGNPASGTGVAPG